MTAFDVNHDGYLDVNEQLYRAVGQLGTIIEELNTALRNIPQAAWGDAQPIWLENQARWNAAYGEMTRRINVTTISSINIHEIFKGGDNMGARIFLG
jgi:uncharacterized protein YukE